MEEGRNQPGLDRVWIISENTWGWRITYNVFVSVVKYVIDDKLYQKTFENEDLLEWQEAVNDYWTE